VNFWEPHTLPEKFRGRRIYQHNPKQTLIRTDPDENAELGRIIASKLNLSIGPVAVYFPLQGISVISAPGGPYWWPEADAALLASLQTHLRKDIPVHVMDMNINDPLFSRAMAEGLLAMNPADRVQARQASSRAGAPLA
jgi:uncharacterized protein (UPF0261 family)